MLLLRREFHNCTAINPSKKLKLSIRCIKTRKFSDNSLQLRAFKRPSALNYQSHKSWRFNSLFYYKKQEMRVKQCFFCPLWLIDSQFVTNESSPDEIRRRPAAANSRQAAHLPNLANVCKNSDYDDSLLIWQQIIWQSCKRWLGSGEEVSS